MNSKQIISDKNSKSLKIKNILIKKINIHNFERKI